MGGIGDGAGCGASYGEEVGVVGERAYGGEEEEGGHVAADEQRGAPEERIPERGEQVTMRASANRMHGG